MIRRLTLISAIILLVGLCGSVFIYLTAEEDHGNVLGYTIIGGDAYPIQPEDSKTYRHDLELYGGKWGLMADDFNRWFAGLWKGKSLAYTVAVITVFCSLIVLLLAKAYPLLLKSGTEERKSGIISDKHLL